MTSFSYASPYAVRRVPVMARNIVSTSQPLAAQAGLGALARGGNAVDAALTAAITLTVVEPTGNVRVREKPSTSHAPRPAKAAMLCDDDLSAVIPAQPSVSDGTAFVLPFFQRIAPGETRCLALCAPQCIPAS